jgi:hypothetical protein
LHPQNRQKRVQLINGCHICDEFLKNDFPFNTEVIKSSLETIILPHQDWKLSPCWFKIYASLSNDRSAVVFGLELTSHVFLLVFFRDTLII